VRKKVNSQQKKIDLFLKQIQLLSKTNKYVDSRQIYLQLTDQGLSEDERDKDLSYLVPKLLKENNEKQKKFVFDYGSWILFVGGGWARFDNHEETTIKLYISLKEKDIDKSVKKILNFMSKNNISHRSKLAKCMRMDDFVVRVSNPVDAKKVINFVNNNKFLADKLRDPSPFCINAGKVGMAMDHSLSYNDVLSKYIYSYVLTCNGSDKTASSLGFLDYVQSKNLKIMTEELSDHVSLAKTIVGGYKRLSETLYSIEEISEIIECSLTGLSEEDFYSRYSKKSVEEYRAERRKYYNHFSDGEFRQNKELLIEIIKTMCLKYGYEFTKDSLVSYKRNKNFSNITREKGLRDKVANSYTFWTYIHMIDLEEMLEEYKPVINEKQEDEVKSIEEIILEQVCKITYDKAIKLGYNGLQSIAMALLKMQQNCYTYITRDGNARDMAKEFIKPEDVNFLVKKSLEANGYIVDNEDFMFIDYATHIEHLCSSSKNKGKVNK